MSPETAADTAVLVSAILMLLAIASKLVTANLVTRSKRVYAKLDVTRREIAGRLKEVQLKRTSARGTLEFWERRRTETSQKVQDATRDLENYAAQFAAEEGGDDDGVLAETGEVSDPLQEGLLDAASAEGAEETNDGDMVAGEIEAVTADGETGASDEVGAEAPGDDPAEPQEPLPRPT